MTQPDRVFYTGRVLKIVFASEEAVASWQEARQLASREDCARCFALLREVGDVGWTERKEYLRPEKNGIFTLLAGRILMSGWFVVRSTEFVIALAINCPRPSKDFQVNPEHMTRILQEKELY